MHFLLGTPVLRSGHPWLVATQQFLWCIALTCFEAGMWCDTTYEATRNTSVWMSGYRYRRTLQTHSTYRVASMEKVKKVQLTKERRGTRWDRKLVRLEGSVTLFSSLVFHLLVKVSWERTRQYGFPHAAVTGSGLYFLWTVVNSRYLLSWWSFLGQAAVWQWRQ